MDTIKKNGTNTRETSIQTRLPRGTNESAHSSAAISSIHAPTRDTGYSGQYPRPHVTVWLTSNTGNAQQEATWRINTVDRQHGLQTLKAVLFTPQSAASNRCTNLNYP